MFSVLEQFIFVLVKINKNIVYNKLFNEKNMIRDHIKKIKIFNLKIVFLKKLKSMFSFISIIMHIFINKINEYG